MSAPMTDLAAPIKIFELPLPTGNIKTVQPCRNIFCELVAAKVIQLDRSHKLSQILFSIWLKRRIFFISSHFDEFTLSRGQRSILRL